MRSLYLRIWAIFLMLFVVAFSAIGETRPGSPEFVSVRIIHTNDIHGHILPEPDHKSKLNPPPMLGGAASLATAIRQLRREPAFGRAPDVVLYFDAGDFFQGTPEGTIPRGESMIELFHMLDLDVMAAGNHDFDLGPEQLERLVNLAHFPILSANTLDIHTGAPALGLQPRMILKRGQLRIGVFGLITEDMPSITVKSAIEGCTFSAVVETARREVDILKAAGCDLIFGLTHAGTESDTRVAIEVPGIAAIIGGHSPYELSPHFRSDATQTVVVHTGAHTRHVGAVDLLVHLPSRRVVQSNARLLRLYASEFPPDKKIQAWADRLRAEVSRELDVVIAESDTVYTKSRFRECTIGNLLADAMRLSTGADAAFMNNRGIRGILPAGPVRLRDVFTIMPFDNTITTLTLTGREVLELLEEGASLERDILHASGITMEVSYAKPVGRRVRSVRIGGLPIQRSKLYRIATNSFLATGGDLFETFTRGRSPEDRGYLLRDAIRDRIVAVAQSAAGRFSGQVEGRIKIIGAAPAELKDD